MCVVCVCWAERWFLRLLVTNMQPQCACEQNNKAGRVRETWSKGQRFQCAFAPFRALSNKTRELGFMFDVDRNNT